jgi:hypothetical protein
VCVPLCCARSASSGNLAVEPFEISVTIINYKKMIESNQKLYKGYEESCDFHPQFIERNCRRTECLPVEGDGALPLYELLTRRGVEHAPAFSSGNILFHSIGAEDGSESRPACRFAESVPTAPGIRYVSLFPLTNVQVTNDRLADEAAGVYLYRNGQQLAVQWLEGGRIWTPSQVTEQFISDGVTLTQQCAILDGRNGDVLGMKLHFDGDWQSLELEICGKFFRTSKIECDSSGVLRGEIVRESENFHFYDWCPWKGKTPPALAIGTCYCLQTVGLEVTDCQCDGTEGATYRLRGHLTNNDLWLYFSAGLTRKAADEALSRAFEGDSTQFFARAAEKYHQFFRKAVPAFACSDHALERVYAELNATTCLSRYQVDCEPYHYRFSCPAAKTFAPWRMQFYHDSIFSSRAQLWLNDPQGCTDDLLQMVTVEYVHCTPRLGLPMVNQSDCMPLVFNMLPQAALEMYRRYPDPKFLSELFAYFLAYDRNKLRPRTPDSAYDETYEEFPPFSWLFPRHHFDNDGDWLVESQLSGDDTCRGDEFCSGTQSKNWWDFPDPPLEPADINFYVLGNRHALQEMAHIIGAGDTVENELKTVIANQREAIEKTLWDDAAQRYCDVTERGHRKSHIADVQNITVPLFTGMVTPERAKQITTAIFDPEIFATPLPLPSCPLNNAGINGKAGFDPTGYWRGLSWGLMYYEAIIGLYNYGMRKEAVFLLRKMMQAQKASYLPAAENFNALTKQAVGSPFMGYSSQLLNPLMMLTSGLQMDANENELRFDPVGLDPRWEYFEFGPFAYRPDITIRVSWGNKRPYCVKVNDQEFSFEQPTAFRLTRTTDQRWQLVPESVQAVELLPPEPLVARWEHTQLVLENVSTTTRDARLVFRKFWQNHGLSVIHTTACTLAPGEKTSIRVPVEATPQDKVWLLAEIKVADYPFAWSEGTGLI